MSWLFGLNHINAILHIGSIVCWAIGIGAGWEYWKERWPSWSKSVACIMWVAFFLALSSEYLSYRYDDFRDPGVPTMEWFTANTSSNETFTIADDPVAGSVEVLINGLDEPTNIFSVHGRTVMLLFEISPNDSVTIKYRHKR